MMKNRKAFARNLGMLAEELIQSRERDEPGFISLIATGAAFEGWLAFEMRVALEKKRHRKKFGLPSRFWIANEYRKVDLGILEYADDKQEGDDKWWAAIEFKLIYNNKNWTSQCDGVWDDLIPPAGSKKAAIEADRLALVTVVRGEYCYKNPHQRRADLDVGWRDALDSYLLQTDTAHRDRIEVLWPGTLFPVTGRWLRDPPRAPHSLQFLVLGPTEAEIKRSR